MLKKLYQTDWDWLLLLLRQTTWEIIVVWGVKCHRSGEMSFGFLLDWSTISPKLQYTGPRRGSRNPANLSVSSEICNYKRVLITNFSFVVIFEWKSLWTLPHASGSCKELRAFSRLDMMQIFRYFPCNKERLNIAEWSQENKWDHNMNFHCFSNQISRRKINEATMNMEKEIITCSTNNDWRFKYILLIKHTECVYFFLVHW